MNFKSWFLKEDANTRGYQSQLTRGMRDRWHNPYGQFQTDTPNYLRRAAGAFAGGIGTVFNKAMYPTGVGFPQYVSDFPSFSQAVGDVGNDAQGIMLSGHWPLEAAEGARDPEDQQSKIRGAKQQIINSMIKFLQSKNLATKVNLTPKIMDVRSDNAGKILYLTARFNYASSTDLSDYSNEM